MIIQDSQVSLSSRQLTTQSYQKSESLKAWVGNTRPDFEGAGAAKGGGEGGSTGDRVRISVQPAVQPPPAAAAAGEAAQADAAAAAETGTDPKYLLLKLLVERLLHTKITLINPAQTAAAPLAAPAPAVADAATPAGQGSAAQPAGYGVEYDLTETRQESETSSFSAGGVVKTADGQQLNFTLNLNMTRASTSEASLTLRAGDAVMKDPLVINFNGAAAQLSDARVAFDIDGDGQSDQVALPAGNSALLALDKNGDGKINDGGELFGALTGNGFAELAAYDSDGNGWIDEKDPVYSRLRAWAGGADGSGGQQTLREAGVGAIDLASVKTPFSLKGADNEQLGAVKSTGIYLSENGSAGTIQQIDLAV